MTQLRGYSADRRVGPVDAANAKGCPDAWYLFVHEQDGGENLHKTYQQGSL